MLYKLKEKTNGIFLEYGATNGVDLSNTYLLENKFNWKGVLSEPSNKWHLNLKKNRPNSKILHECIYSQTGKSLNFFTIEGTKSYLHADTAPDGMIISILDLKVFSIFF